MTGLHNFLRSPLARHPGLLGRKVGARLGRWSERGPAPAPTVSRAVVPASWSGPLWNWIARLPLDSGAHPFNRVFGRDFDEAVLLRLCREGPRRGARDLTGDIKLIWDYSRAHALVANAASGALGPAAGAAFLRRWLEANSDQDGPAWRCAMDIAIRAVNWIVADLLWNGRLGRELGDVAWAGWLWRHGWLTWRRLEARLISSNHYLANLVGLLFIGALFPDNAAARRWWRFAAGEFPRALLAQTRTDGGLAEASLRYHAFVTEMALLARLALGASLPAAAAERIDAMVQVVADFRQADGGLFAVGDDDSGRVLALDHAAHRAGQADVVLALAAAVIGRDFSTSPARTCPDSGWWIRRHGDFTAVFEFGGVGLAGIGGHAHNDDLSMCVEWRGQPVIVDPGSGAYGFDPELRNRLRSARAHNLVMVDDREVRPPGGELFQLRGSDVPLEFSAPDPDTAEAQAVLAAGVRHTRRVAVGPGGVIVTDRLAGNVRHRFTWRFHLHPAVEVTALVDGFRLKLPGAGELLLTVEPPIVGTVFTVEPAEFAPAYAQTEPTRVAVATLEADGSIEAAWNLRPAAN